MLKTIVRISRQSRGSRSMERRSRLYRESLSPLHTLLPMTARIKPEPYENLMEALMITVEEGDVKADRNTDMSKIETPCESKTSIELGSLVVDQNDVSENQIVHPVQEVSSEE